MKAILGYTQLAVLALPLGAFGAAWGRYAAGLMIPFIPLFCAAVLTSLGYSAGWEGNETRPPTWNDTLDSWCTISSILALFLSPPCVGILLGRSHRYVVERRQARVDQS